VKASPPSRHEDNLLSPRFVFQVALGGLLWNVVQSNRPSDCPRIDCDSGRNYDEYVANLTSDNPACMVRVIYTKYIYNCYYECNTTSSNRTALPVTCDEERKRNYGGYVANLTSDNSACMVRVVLDKYIIRTDNNTLNILGLSSHHLR